MLPSLPFGDSALFLDVDGTLLDIASRPDGVIVSDRLRNALATLDEHLGGAVALVSGRAIADLDGLFAPLRLRASGVHGAEVRFDPAGETAILDQHRLPDALIAALRKVAGRYPGSLVEDKRFSVAIHYRAAPEAGTPLRAELDRLLDTPDDQGCIILPGHMVFEVKRTGFDKGTAIGRFLEQAPFRQRRPIFIGDDVTDLPGFARTLSEGGLAYSVTTPRPGLSGHFADPAAVRAWIEALAAQTIGEAAPR